jgi:hypothetical protein
VFPQDEVDAFMAADKVAPGLGRGGRPFRWDERNTWANVRQPVEVDAAQVGEVVLVASVETPQHWTFSLRYRGVEVYRLDVRPTQNLGNHTNPANRPAGFPRKVSAPHEHVYVEDLDLKCAQSVDASRVTNHEQAFGLFCERARLSFEDDYQPPPLVRPRFGYG